MVSSINYGAVKRRLARVAVAATVVLGTCTHVAMALYPEPEAATAASTTAPHSSNTALPAAALDRL
jgi:hypothetical protein